VSVAAAPRRILVRMPNWLGDAVMATPGLRALRRRFPEATIVAWVRPGLEGLLDASPSIDEVVRFDAWRAGPRALWRAARALAPRDFELGVCLPDSFSAALAMRIAGVRHVVGYARGARGPLLHEAVAPRREWGPRRLVARERSVLHLLEAIGCPPQGSGLELGVDPADAERLTAQIGVVGQAPLVVLAPGAAFGPSKLWPLGSFARLADALADEGCRIVITGDAGETALGRALAAAMRAPATDLCGRIDTGALKALIRRAALVVCNDSGTRHLASAFATPSIVLLGPTDLARTDCNLERVTVLTNEVGCRPCYRRRCPIDHGCLRGIEVGRVLETARHVLAAGGARGG